MDAPSAFDREVAPDLRGGPEVQLIDPPCCGLEAIAAVLAGDTHCYDVGIWLALSSRLQVKRFWKQDTKDGRQERRLRGGG